MLSNSIGIHCRVNTVSRRLLLRSNNHRNVLSSCSAFSLNDTTRSYHATHKPEILPLIGAATILFIGRYSWKALQRMDDEWDDYQWHLSQYEKQHGVVLNKEAQTKWPGGTLAVDVGSMHLVFAHKALQAKAAEVVVTREGARYSFSGIQQKQDNEEDDVLLGQRAYEQYFELPPQQHDASIVCNVQLPFRMLQSDNPEKAKTAVSTVVQSALKDVLDKTQTQLDQVRPIVTLSPDLQESHQVFDSALGDTASPPTYIPEPVAAIWGAQQVKLIPQAVETPIVVVDVGGHVTSLSVVQKNVVLQTMQLLKFGGETFVQEILQHVLEEMPSLAHDLYALPRIYQAAQAAAAEFNVHTRATINIPYIGMDLTTREPQHVDMELSRQVLEQAIQNHVHNVLVPNASQHLSPHMPPPTDLSTLWTSLLTQLLEETHLTPMNVSHILVVGGGAKQSLVVSSLQSSWTSLTGNLDAMEIPQIGVRSELVAMGAASLLPNYHYDAHHGLVRDE